MQNKIIRIKQVREITGLSRATIYRRMSEGKFPARISLGGHAVGWLEAEIMQWIEKCASMRELRTDSESDV